MGRLFAISDIHGCYKPFEALVNNCLKLDKSDRLILMGDYIDRGPQSKEVIDFILDLYKNGFNIVSLTGNHEAMLMDSFYHPDLLPGWMMNGAITTLTSFGIKDIREIDARYLDFFSSLNYFKIAGDVIFVHAGFNDSVKNPFTDRHSMIWECRASYQNPVFSGKTIIHGHRPVHIRDARKLIREKSMVIPIDTGCVYGEDIGYGMLSALEVNSMTLYSVPLS